MQYIDMIKDLSASSKTSAVFIPHGPGAVGDLAGQLRAGFLQAQAALGNH